MKAVVLFLVVLMCTMELTRFTLAEESPAAEAQDNNVFLEETEAVEKREAQDEDPEAAF